MRKPFAGTFHECFHKVIPAGADVWGLHNARKREGMNQRVCACVQQDGWLSGEVGVGFGKSGL